MSKTSRTYNATVSHRRRILSSTSGQHPSRWNDNTLILYDDFVVGLKEGTILEDYEFNLYEYGDNDTDIITVRYKGVWLIVDNGYLNWSVTIPPHIVCF